jgi:uncharacterized membrane protein YfcA
MYTCIAVFIAQSEQQLKIRFGNINIVKSDIKCNGKSLKTLLALGFIGGWAAGSLGIGGGAIFTPALITLGVPPLVVTATGLYMVTFSTIASCLIYYLNGQLIFNFAIWICFWATIGTIIGLVICNHYLAKSGKQNPIVWVLFGMFIVSVIAVPLFGGLGLKK